MNVRLVARRRSVCGSGVLIVALCLGAPGEVLAADQVGSVTLMMGAPRMVGQSIRALQPVLSGNLLETGESDAVGLLVEDIVVHIGVKSKVTLREDAGRVLIEIEAGFVVIYTGADTRREVVAETPFGRLTAMTEASGIDSGSYAVRHDPEEPNVSPAVSTFSTIEGQARAEGIRPVAGPHTLMSNQKWRIVEGEVPGPPEDGGDGSAAEQLQDMLHRRTSELVHAGIGDITLRPLGPFVGPRVLIPPDRQRIYNNNDTNSRRPRPSSPPVVPPVSPPAEKPPEEPQVGDADVIPSGEPVRSLAQFVSYEGTPADPNWNQFLTSVDGNPAFQPEYIDRFDNGGFSYIQFAGGDARLTSHNGELFLVGEPNTQGGWALFTPEEAVADANFTNVNSALLGVVTEGFRSIARGDHLAGNGAIGGDGQDPASAFAVAEGGIVRLNPDLPAGYPLLDQAADTIGLTVDGQVIRSDQIAALGAGRNPQQLSEPGPQLLFLSDSDTDAFGNNFNFDGDLIRPTELDLPGDRAVVVDQRSDAPSQGQPLAADPDNTVGIQFAARGDVVAIIHHTGLGDGADGQSPGSEHFEVVREDRHSVVQWRDGERVTGSDGQVLEAEDLNENPELRNELFALLSDEVNNLTPSGRHTVSGPATTEPGSAIARTLRRQPGKLIRIGQTFKHRQLQVRRGFGRPPRSLKGLSRTLKPAGGRLLRPGAPSSMRRHIGRVRAAQ